MAEHKTCDELGVCQDRRPPCEDCKRISEGTASAQRILRSVPEAKKLLRRARRLYSVPDVPASINKHNRHQWVRSVEFLGDRWLLAIPQGRIE